MMRFRLNVAPVLVLLVCALGISAFGQDLFEQYEADRNHAPLTEEQKAAGAKESIF